MRGKIAWLKSSVRHRTLAPFDGITRIRFKGSSNWTSQPLRLPPHFYLVENKTPLREVNERQNCRPSVMDVPANLECNCDSADETFRNAISHQPAIGLPPPSRSYGKWQAIDRSPVSRRTRRCNCRRRPYHPPCP